MADETSPGKGVEAAKATILLADTDAALVAGMSEVLGVHGLSCDHVGTWPALMDRLRGITYDLLILEMRLGQVDVVHRFAELSATSTAPIIFLTKDGSEADRILALEKGAASVLRKPISGREIVARVRAQLRRSAAPARPFEPQPTLRTGCGQLGPVAPFAPAAYARS